MIDLKLSVYKQALNKQLKMSSRYRQTGADLNIQNQKRLL